jgi:phosphate acyltransferase
MGGDRAPDAIVRGALQFDGSVLLVGRSADFAALAPNLPTVEASQVIDMDDKASSVLRSKPDASINVAVREVSAGRASAVVTCGHSGAAMVAAVKGLGRLEGVDRPALVTVVPRADGGEAVLLDLGANVDCKPEQLAQFALMGEAYARAVLGIERPRVGLLSNGSERGKGNIQVKAALPLLEELPIEFVGPIEPFEAFHGGADVVVCDGFVGNVMLKTVEATADVTVSLMQKEIARMPHWRLGARFLRSAMRRFRSRTSASAYGGALLLGVNGVVVVAHGRSDKDAVDSALKVARRCVEQDVVGAVAKALAGVMLPG